MENCWEIQEVNEEGNSKDQTWDDPLEILQVKSKEKLKDKLKGCMWVDSLENLQAHVLGSTQTQKWGHLSGLLGIRLGERAGLKPGTREGLSPGSWQIRLLQVKTWRFDLEKAGGIGR